MKMANIIGVFYILSGETVIATADRVEMIGTENIKIYNVKTIHPNTREISWDTMEGFSVIHNDVRKECVCTGITNDAHPSFVSCVWAHITSQ